MSESELAEPAATAELTPPAAISRAVPQPSLAAFPVTAAAEYAAEFEALYC